MCSSLLAHRIVAVDIAGKENCPFIILTIHYSEIAMKVIFRC